MADDAAEGVGLTASQLLGSLRLQPFCDHGDIKHLTPEQQAAMHAFLHEVMAAYYRMTILVPENIAVPVLNKRFAKATKKRSAQGEVR